MTATSTDPSQEYRTPPKLFAALHAEFVFTFDLAADESNHIVPRGNLVGPIYASLPCWGDPPQAMFDAEGHLMAQPVGGCPCGLHRYFVPGTHRFFCNPPFNNMPAWVERFAQLARDGHLVVALSRCDPSTDWWGKVVQKGAHELRFPAGRIQYVHPPDCRCKQCQSGRKSGNDSPSVIQIWRPGRRRSQPKVVWLWRPGIQ